MTDDKHPTDLIPAYALGSLDSMEEARVEAHLMDCETCREQFQEYNAVADYLAYSAPQMDPPAGLKSRLLERIPETGDEESISRARGTWAQRLLAPLRMSPAWSLASLLVIVTLAISNVLLWQQVSNLNSAQPSEFLVVRMAGTDFDPDATGLLVITPDGGQGTLVVDNLTDLGKGQQYQLWLIRNGQRDDGGVFSVSDEGYGTTEIWGPDSLLSYSAFGITIEPTGGSPGPTGEKVLGGNF